MVFSFKKVLISPIYEVYGILTNTTHCNRISEKHSFAFAQDSKRVWVELELKSRKSKNQRYSQDDLYVYLKINSKMSNSKAIKKITWNEEDIGQSPRSSSGKDIRIKIYLNSDNRELWVDAMCELAEIFLPILKKFRNA